MAESADKFGSGNVDWSQDPDQILPLFQLEPPYPYDYEQCFSYWSAQIQENHPGYGAVDRESFSSSLFLDPRTLQYIWDSSGRGIREREVLQTLDFWANYPTLAQGRMKWSYGAGGSGRDKYYHSVFSTTQYISHLLRGEVRFFFFFFFFFVVFPTQFCYLPSIQLSWQWRLEVPFYPESLFPQARSFMDATVCPIQNFCDFASSRAFYSGKHSITAVKYSVITCRYTGRVLRVRSSDNALAVIRVLIPVMFFM